MSLYSGYDDFYKDHPSSIVLGGRHRAATACRDDQGRFMPNDVLKQIVWELDPDHGKAGARARWTKRKDSSNA